ncbi:IS200/IS605-like element ISDra9 family transposase [soil metagenome]
MNLAKRHYRKASHCVYDIVCCLVWATKYRKAVFFGQEALRIRAIIKDVCAELEVHILSGNVRPDHIKLIVSILPTISISTVVGKIKGKSAHFMFAESEGMRREFPKGHLWATGYSVTTNVTIPPAEISECLRLMEPELENS